MVRYLGSAQGTRLLWPPAWHLQQDTGRRVRSPAPSPTREGRANKHQEGPRCWMSLGGIEMKWETHRGGTHLLGLWMLAPDKCGCQATPGEGRSWAVSDPYSDSLQTGWKVVLCEKLCACWELQGTAGHCFIRNSPAAAGAP